MLHESSHPVDIPQQQQGSPSPVAANEDDNTDLDVLQIDSCDTPHDASSGSKRAGRAADAWTVVGLKRQSRRLSLKPE